MELIRSKSDIDKQLVLSVRPAPLAVAGFHRFRLYAEQTFHLRYFEYVRIKQNNA